MKFNPVDNTFHDKPVWVVYGHDCFPQIICCKLESKLHGYTVIWGYSIYRRSPGFRTMGRDVLAWMAEMQKTYSYSLFEFYSEHDEAIDRIRELTTPKVKK